MEYRRKLFFGKYKGRYIDDIIREDLQYIGWCMKNVKFLQFTEEETNAYNTALKDLIVQRSKMKNYKKRIENYNSK